MRLCCLSATECSLLLAISRQMESSETASKIAPHVWGLVARCLPFDEASKALVACGVPSVRGLCASWRHSIHNETHRAWLQGRGCVPVQCHALAPGLTSG